MDETGRTDTDSPVTDASSDGRSAADAKRAQRLMSSPKRTLDQRATPRKKRANAPAIGSAGARRGPYRVPDGQGHGEAHPPALPDFVPHGRAPAGDRAGDPPRRRGLQRDERGRLRAALLRRPLRAGLAGHRADRRAAGRRRRRAGELLAAPGELPPAGDRVLRRRAGRAADRAVAARRRVRLRRAAAPGPAADLVGALEPDERARAALGRPRHQGLGRRPRALPAPGEDRDRDLPQQDDHVRLLHDGPRRHGHAQGRPLPPALQGRVLPARLRPRAQGAARLPPVAHPRQGRLRDEGRARLQGPARGLRPAPVRQPRRLAVRRPGRDRRDRDLRAHRLADRAPLRPLRRGPARRHRRRHRLRDAVRRSPPAHRLGAAARRARPRARAARARARARRARRAAARAPPGRHARARRPGRRRRRATRPRPSRRPTARAARRPRSGPSASRGS